MEPDDISMRNLLYSLLSAEGSYKSQKVRVCNYSYYDNRILVGIRARHSLHAEFYLRVYHSAF